VDAAAHAGPELRLIVGCGVIDDEGDRGSRCTLRYFWLEPRLGPPISIVASGLKREATGTTCGLPSAPMVAKRPSWWAARYADSLAVRGFM
jgi:hypothetical protein